MPFACPFRRASPSGKSSDPVSSVVRLPLSQDRVRPWAALPASLARHGGVGREPQAALVLIYSCKFTFLLVWGRLQIVIIIIIIIISITILIIFIINIMCITSTSNIINITSSNTSITLTAISVNGISVTTSMKTYSLSRRDYLHPKLIVKNLSNSKKGPEKKGSSPFHSAFD